MRPRIVGDAAFVHLAQIWAIASRTFETESSTACFSSSHFSMANRSTASQNSAYESISESSTGGSSLDLRPDEAFVRLPRDFFEPREPIEPRSSIEDGPFFFGCCAFFGWSGWSLS